MVRDILSETTWTPPSPSWGAGEVGAVLARLAVAAGYHLLVAASAASTAVEAAERADIVVLALPSANTAPSPPPLCAASLSSTR